MAARTRLDEAVLATGIPFLGHGQHAKFLKELHQISQRVAGVRRFGSAALDLAFVAAGRFDGFWERDLGAWDLAAGTLLVTEAGGKVTGADGGDEVIDTGTVCAANLDLHPLILERLRAADEDMVINLTTGPGQRFVPSEADPSVAAPGTTLMRPEPRVAHVRSLRPELCSLDLNTMYSGTSVVINTPANLAIMAELITEAGVKPELEVFDSGDIQLGNHFIQQGRLDPSTLFQIVLGVRYGAIASPETLMYMKSLLPPAAPWSAFGVGRWEFPMLAQSWLLGGHVRVGLEDNIYLEKGVLAESNAALVAKAVRMVRDLGGRVATAGEARDILGLKKQAPKPA